MRSGGTTAGGSGDRPRQGLDDSYVRDLRAEFAARGRSVWALDVTSDLGIPAIVAVAHWEEQGHERIEVAAGAHFDPRIATLRAMTELNQFLAIDQMRRRPNQESDDYGDDPLPLRRHAYTPVARQSSRSVARGSGSSRASIGASRC